MKPKLIVLIAGVCVLLAPVSVKAFDEIYFTPGNYQPFDDCNGITEGRTLLWDLYELPFDGPDAQIAREAVEEQYWGFTCEPAFDSLKGDLTVDWYKAFDYDVAADCCHGAEITVHYDPHEDELVDFLWIQLYTEHGTSGNGLNHVDGEDDIYPFYFTETDDPCDYIHVPYPGGVIFGDSPHDKHLENQAWWGAVEFYLYLASYNPEFQIVTLYDGIYWGYTATCIPEPASILLLGLGGLALVRRRWR